MVERFVEIDARVFLDGTLTSRRVFQLTGPGTRVFPRYSWRFRVLTKGLTVRRGQIKNWTQEWVDYITLLSIGLPPFSKLN